MRQADSLRASAAAVEAEGRNQRVALLATESNRALQAKLRRQEETVEQYQKMLTEARAALRREKASSAAESKRLSEQLYEQHEEGIQKLQKASASRAHSPPAHAQPTTHHHSPLQALTKLDEVPEPKPSGAELTAAQMEELLLEKDERIDQLVRELADAKSALETTRLHLQERATHVETLEAQLDVAGKREPTHQMYQQVNQLRAKVTSRERDLGRMRDALKTLKEVTHTRRLEPGSRRPRPSLPLRPLTPLLSPLCRT